MCSDYSGNYGGDQASQWGRGGSEEELEEPTTILYLYCDSFTCESVQAFSLDRASGGWEYYRCPVCGIQKAYRTG